MLRKFFGFVLMLVGFILALIGTMSIVKEAEKTTYIILLLIGAVLFVLGALLPKYKSTKTKKGLLAFFACILAVTFVIGRCTPTETEKQQKEIENAEKWKERDNSTEAYIMAQGFVKQLLKSPSSAKFPSLTDKEVFVSKNGFIYTVSGYVNATNSFGATVKTFYVCELEQIDKDNWKKKIVHLVE
jgi:uncharacterized membrane protein YfcA